jgi:dTDP-4-amino-4,6-dideoxygalactose transaminase
MITEGDRMIVRHSRPTIGQDDVKAVEKVLFSGMITQGEKVSEFEKAVAVFVGKKHGVAVSSGTAALHLALRALTVGSRREVILPSYVCSSPYLAVLHAGGVPKVVDIDLSDFNICASTAKNQITSKTSAILVPHMFGTPAELDELLRLGVPVVEDCAQSLGAQFNGKNVGSFGDLSVFSFYATKMITTGEGGMVLTDDSELYEQILDLRGYDKKGLETRERASSHALGYNYKMTDFQAALGLSQLAKLQGFITRRLRIAQVYDEAFADCGVTLPRRSEHRLSVYYRYVVLVDRLLQVRKKLKKLGVICERPVFVPLHRAVRACGCKNTDRVFAHALSVPLYPGLTDEEVRFVTRTVRKVFREFQ